MFQVKLLAVALEVVLYSLVLTSSEYVVPSTPSECCDGDAPDRDLEKVSQGEYNKHKGALALLNCDERPLRVFTDANSKVPRSIATGAENAFRSGADVPGTQVCRNTNNIPKSRPRPVGLVYVENESIKKLEHWVKTHPYKAKELLRYINISHIHVYSNFTH